MNRQTLWYTKPAQNFDEALPIGNGRIGGMVYGNPLHDLIHLNEDSIWSGGPRKRNNPKSLEALKEIRNLLINEKIEEAEQILFDCMAGSNPNTRHYMPLGNLHLTMCNPDEAINEALGLPKEYDAAQAANTTDFKRSLDLTQAISHVTYVQNGVTYHREYFVSHPDNALIIHITADKPKAISCKVSIDGRDDYFDNNIAINNNTILYDGGCGSSDGIFFQSLLNMNATGATSTVFGTNLVVHQADEVTLYFCVRTSFYDTIANKKPGSYRTLCEDDLKNALSVSYDFIKSRHIDDYQKLFSRVVFSLGKESDNDLPTDERLNHVKNAKKLNDLSLVSLYCDYSRYLIISASRPNTLPLNLQGIWNKDMWPAWGSKYTININLQMNYWPVEILNLSECHLPVFDLLERMRPNGRETAKTMYGCRGFCAHHNTDLWGDCAPQDFWMPATIWPMGAAWIALHIFEHYEFTQDSDFLAKEYDTLKEAALFFVDYLMEDSKKRLVTGPSVSPENTYKTQSGSTGCVCLGPSMDSQIITVLFQDILKSHDILTVKGKLTSSNEEDEFISTLTNILTRLPKPEIGKYGQIKEWAEDYDEVEPGHRHVSHLFGLYPADLITPAKSKELSEAARTTLQRRLANGGGHTGWSRAWMINFWARLKDADEVMQNVHALLGNSTNPNLLDSHPPFQIDGNFGGAAGVIEALIQSHSNEIVLLPALPKEWSDGKLQGVMARGGFEISFSWKDGKLTYATILSHAGKPCRILIPSGMKVVSNHKEVLGTWEDAYFCFNTEPETVYNLVEKID